MNLKEHNDFARQRAALGANARAQAEARRQAELRKAQALADLQKVLVGQQPAGAQSLGDLLRARVLGARSAKPTTPTPSNDLAARAAKVAERVLKRHRSAKAAEQAGDVHKFVAFSAADIRKLDDEQRMVYGYASRTSLDNQGETVTKAAMEDALPGYMKFANLREMHGNSAVGVVKAASVDDSGLYIEAHVVDDDAWRKVKAGVYKGFSIGGKAITKTKGVIQKMRLTEISLVDRPANQECLITATA